MAKFRMGYVSNSSSSSFICDITGNVESGMDASLSDFEMAQCKNDHTFMVDGYPEVQRYLEDEIDENGKEYDEDTEYEEDEFSDDRRYEIPATLCPVCNGSAKQAIVERLKGEFKRLNLTIEDFQ